ncbi:hypothetical protein GCM10009000_065520 [Halobacterium noricense]|uniref:Transposase n=1 Tax=Haladaptatus pallidirubidus TaxID=1008152 RepID=A0AAV3UHR9_9EURY
MESKTDDCWVTEYQADINATANIAGRLNPWGRESLSLKPTDDDSLQDGSTCDSALGHYTPSPKLGQTTLSTYSD